MCGIAGQINLDTAQPVDAAILQRMAAAIAHRGPDAEGLWTDGPAGLAHRRLSIIDLSEAANQPMSNEDGSVWIVYNGEIYNFLDLREHLARRGHVLRTRSDTEVLIHLYEDEGENMLARLRGMFAFAIWDVRRRRLFAARDRIGKKPFKYHLDRRRFVFASELKAILARGDVAAEIDDADIHQYLGFGYVFAPNTGYRGIQKLPPAHYLILENGRLRIERYWRLDYRNKTTLSYRDCQERILELLDEATRLRLISDVPLGAFLSGGVDSSAVVGFMARHASQPVRTFSIGFDFERLNELPYARQIAKRFSTDHTEHVVHARSAEVLPRHRHCEGPGGKERQVVSTEKAPSHQAAGGLIHQLDPEVARDEQRGAHGPEGDGIHAMAICDGREGLSAPGSRLDILILDLERGGAIIEE